MHPIVNYSDEEKQEFLARCKILTHDHEWWKVGEWYYESGQVILIGDESLVDTIFIFRLDDLIWLPLSDDLINMKGWGGEAVSWFLEDKQKDIGTSDERVTRYAVYERSTFEFPIKLNQLILAPTRLLAIIRALQICSHTCEQETPDEWHCEEHDTHHVDLEPCENQCFGICKGTDHKCEYHWRENNASS